MIDPDELLGPPVYVFRDDPLFSRGSIAAELALGILLKLRERYDINADDWSDIDHAVKRLEAFLGAVQLEAAERAASADRSPKGGDHKDGRHAEHESAVPKGDAQ